VATGLSYHFDVRGWHDVAMASPHEPSPERRRRSRFLVAATALAFVTGMAVTAFLVSSGLPEAGGSTSARERPATFVSRSVGQIISDDFATAWDALYPAHKAVAPKDEYVSCELRTRVGWKLRAAKVVRVASELRRIPGEAERVPVELVTLRLTIAQPSVRARNVFVHTFTAVADGDHWAWILTPGKYELYRSDGCDV
jgi:hypothetical protein